MSDQKRPESESEDALDVAARFEQRAKELENDAREFRWRAECLRKGSDYAKLRNRIANSQ